MKRIKSFTSALLTLILGLSLLTTGVFAASSTLGGLTITGVKNGYTYELYRIFDLTGSDTDADGSYDKVSYSINSPWVNFFFGENALGTRFLSETEIEGSSPLIYNGKTYYIYIVDDSTSDNSAKNLANLALTYVLNGNLTADYSTTIATDETSYTFSAVELGYYLIYPVGATIAGDGGTIASLTITKPCATVAIKAGDVDIDKEVDDPSVYIGQTVTYTATSTVPNTEAYTKYQFVVSDTMDAGLTFDGLSSIVVMFGNTNITVPDSSKNTTLEEITDNNGAVIGFRLEFDMTKYQDYVGEEITITYTATVNEDAVSVSTNNHIVLEYSNNPDDETDTEQKTDDEPVYSAKIIVDKYDGSDGTKNTKLSGATFVLYKYDTDGTTEMFYCYDSTTGVSWVYDVNDATSYTTNSSGVAEFIGLEDGVYYLRETAAPDGFNALSSDIEVTIDAVSTILGSTTDLTDAEITELLSIEAEVANNTGSLLPTTGGVGTTIFYVVGVFFVFGAVILLVTRERMKKKN